MSNGAELCSVTTGPLWAETSEAALISYKRLQYSLMLKLILLDTVYLPKTHWHGTFLSIRRLRVLFVTTFREDSCISWLRKGRERRQPCEICLPLIARCISRCCHWMSLWHIPSRNLAAWLTPARMRCVMCNNVLRSFPTQLPSAASASTKTGLFTDLRGGTEMACIVHIFNISFFLSVCSRLNYPHPPLLLFQGAVLWLTPLKGDVEIEIRW